MKKIVLFLFIFILFTIDSSAQIEEPLPKLSTLRLSGKSKPKYFDVNHKFIFEYGLMISLSREEPVASTGSVTYDFNLILKKLYGSVQLGVGIAHGEDRAGVGGLFGFGFDYSVLTEYKYNLSIYLGLMGVYAGWPTAFGVAHVRWSTVTDDIGAFTFGLRYLYNSDHWLMPTFGYLLWLK